MGAVDDGSGPHRIEIELTERDAPRSRRRDRSGGRAAVAAAPPAAPSEGRPDQPAWSGTAPVFVSPAGQEGDHVAGGGDRSRLVVTAIATGAVALFLGWVLGRAGDGDGAAQSIDSATTAPATSVARVAPGDTLPEARLPPASPTTRPRLRPSTTTLPPEWQTVDVVIDPRLAELTDRLVAADRAGGIVEIDIGAATARAAPPVRNEAGVAVTAGDDWVLLPDASGEGRSVLYRDGSADGEYVSGFNPWEVYWQVDTDMFWTGRYGGGGFEGVVEVGLDGAPTGREIDTRGLGVMAADPAGGVLTGVTGLGNFRVTPEGSERLADGRLLAIGVAHLLLFSCADDLDSCGLTVVDRSTGDARVIPLDPEIEPFRSQLGAWYGPLQSRPGIPADGSMAVVGVTDLRSAQTIAGVIDLASGEFTRIGDDRAGSDIAYGLPSAVWGTAGRFLYYLDGSLLNALDTETGDVISIPVGDRTFGAVTVRPAEPLPN